MRSSCFLSCVLLSLVFLSSPAFSQILITPMPYDGMLDHSTNRSHVLPEANFDHTYYDAGFLRLGVAQEVVFPFENIGGSTLEVTQVVCTCSNAKVNKQEGSFLPGEKGKIKATITPISRGAVSCQLIIQSNSRKEMEFLNIIGVVK